MSDVAPRKRRSYKFLDVGYKKMTSEWVTCSAPVKKSEDGDWEIPAIHLVDGGASRTAVVKEKSYKYHVLAGVSDPANVLYGECVDLYMQAHLTMESDRGSDNISSSDKDRKRKRQ